MFGTYGMTCKSIRKSVHLSLRAARDSGIVSNCKSGVCLNVQAELDSVFCWKLPDIASPERCLLRSYKWVLSGITARFGPAKTLRWYPRPCLLLDTTCQSASPPIAFYILTKVDLSFSPLLSRTARLVPDPVYCTPVCRSRRLLQCLQVSSFHMIFETSHLLLNSIVRNNWKPRDQTPYVGVSPS